MYHSTNNQFLSTYRSFVLLTCLTLGWIIVITVNGLMNERLKRVMQQLIDLSCGHQIHILPSENSVYQATALLFPSDVLDADVCRCKSTRFKTIKQSLLHRNCVSFQTVPSNVKSVSNTIKQNRTAAQFLATITILTVYAATMMPMVLLEELSYQNTRFYRRLYCVNI